MRLPLRIPIHLSLHVDKKRVGILIGVLVLIIIAASPTVYFYRQYRQAQRRIDNPTETAKQDAKIVITAVSQLMDLPQDEEPTVAVVTDVSKLKDQPFFVNAKNGDKVIIYTKSKKAILYRPETNKIIDVAPVNIGDTATPSAQISPPANIYRLVLLNGTSTAGLTKTFETKLKAKINNLTIVNRDNAARTTYDRTIVIDVRGDKPTEAGQIASSLGVSVSTLPATEATPSSDFVIIVGSDQQ